MTNKIIFTDVDPIPTKNISIIKKNINKIILKKDFILGKSVKIFENNFSKLSKIKYSVGCASGTDALILALKSLNLKKKDEVIVPALTYISTGLSVLLNHNKLIYADIDEYNHLHRVKGSSPPKEVKGEYSTLNRTGLEIFHQDITRLEARTKA